MIRPSQNNSRPRSRLFALLGLVGMMLAYSGCAVGSGARSAYANAAALGTATGGTATGGTATGTIPRRGPVAATETPEITLDPKRLGAKPSLRQQAKKLPAASKKATDTPNIPLAAPDRQPAANAATPATRPDLAAPVFKQVDNSVSNANWEVAQANAGRYRGISDTPRLAPVARRARAVERAQFLAEQQTSTPALAPVTESLDEPAAELPQEPPPDTRRRRARRSESQPASPVPGEMNLDQSSDRPSDTQIRLPLEDSSDDDKIELTPNGDRISLVVRDAHLSSVLNLLAKQRGLNVIVSEDSDSSISVTLTDVEFTEAWSAIIEIAGCTWTQSNNIVMVTSVGGNPKTSWQLQDRQLRVFPLNFVDAKDVQLVVKGILSPAGKVFTMQTLPKERRSTQETVVVEDIPSYVNRVADYIATVDVPPRQVMIEVHILQITLEDNCTHGVNLQYLFGAGGNNVVLSTVGFANPAAATASLFTVSGDHFNSVIQALQNTTDSKTLASPKVIVANGQQARIQIGQRFGYFVTTTTQTSTLQNVNFLNTGVVLAVTPQISADNQVLMSVTPEVSTGQINASGLPQTETTTTDTTVLLPDGCGMVIGGLIKEQDIETQAKVPLLGDLRVIGRLFQTRTVTRQRVEIIIALLPRIAPYPPGYEVQHQIELERTMTPLMQGPLNRAPRPFEAKLPDAFENPRHLRFSRLPDAVPNLNDPYPLPPRYFFPTAQEEYPPVLPPAPVPLHNLSLPPLPLAPGLPPVEVIVPDAPEAAQRAPAKVPAPNPAPVKSAKAKSSKGRPVNRKSVSVQAAPGQPAPGQAAPGQAAPGQAAPGQSAPGQSAPVKSTTGQSAAGPPK